MLTPFQLHEFSKLVNLPLPIIENAYNEIKDEMGKLSEAHDVFREMKKRLNLSFKRQVFTLAALKGGKGTQKKKFRTNNCG